MRIGDYLPQVKLSEIKSNITIPYGYFEEIRIVIGVGQWQQAGGCHTLRFVGDINAKCKQQQMLNRN